MKISLIFLCSIKCNITCNLYISWLVFLFMQNFIKQITNKANKMKSSNVWNKQESVYSLTQADRVNMSCYVIILNVFPYCIVSCSWKKLNSVWSHTAIGYCMNINKCNLIRSVLPWYKFSALKTAATVWPSPGQSCAMYCKSCLLVSSV